MAIDPKKLTAYMDTQEPADDDEITSEYEVEGEEPVEEEIGESPEAEEFEAFLHLLMEHAPEIESAAHAAEILDIADELPEEVADAIHSALEEMPPELVAGMAKYLSQLDPDDLHEIVETMEESGQIENDGIVVPFLYWAARLASTGDEMADAGEMDTDEMDTDEMDEEPAEEPAEA